MSRDCGKELVLRLVEGFWFWLLKSVYQSLDLLLGELIAPLILRI